MSDAENDPIANACEVAMKSVFYSDDKLEDGEEAVSEKTLWSMSFGAYGGTQVYVWTQGGDLNNAFEEAVDWLDGQGQCDVFTTLDEGDLRDAAKSLNIPWNPSWWPGGGATDGSDPQWEKVLEKAEADLTLIGHTSLTHCEKQLGGPLYVPSYEWGGDEITNADEIRKVARRSMQECWSHGFLPGDIIFVPGHALDDPNDAGKYLITGVNGDDLEIENEDSEYSNVPASEVEVEDWASSTPKKEEPIVNPLFRSRYMGPHEVDETEKKRQMETFFGKRKTEEEKLLEAARKRREKEGGYKGGGFLGVDKPRPRNPLSYNPFKKKVGK